MPTNINSPLFADLTHQQPRVTDGRRASTAEDRMLKLSEAPSSQPTNKITNPRESAAIRTSEMTYIARLFVRALRRHSAIYIMTYLVDQR